ncbi:MAG TPA: hypothetical protein PLK49_01330 [Candidatus Dojkabacteria bacterium]|nr:hypothetical protein [Candidatus Dojkabacteria bacterium]
MKEKIGYIKLSRKLLDNPIFKKPAYLTVWIYLLLNAQHKETFFIWNNKKEALKRGQLLTGLKTISKNTRIAQGTVYRILKYLENEKQIEQRKTTKFTIITIVNWDKYQESEKRNEKQIENRLKTDEKQIETYKNDNNVKNDNDIPKGMDTPTYGNKDLISLKKFLINNYPKPLVGITDTRKLQNIRQVSTRRKNQDEWMEDNWKENIKNFLSLYIERTPEEYLVNSIDKLRERIKLWREYRGKLN